MAFEKKGVIEAVTTPNLSAWPAVKERTVTTCPRTGQAWEHTTFEHPDDVDLVKKASEIAGGRKST